MKQTALCVRIVQSDRITRCVCHLGSYSGQTVCDDISCLNADFFKLYHLPQRKRLDFLYFYTQIFECICFMLGCTVPLIYIFLNVVGQIKLTTYEFSSARYIFA